MARPTASKARATPYASHRMELKAALAALGDAPIIAVYGDSEFLVNKVGRDLEQRLTHKGYLIEAKAEQAAFKENWQDWFSERGLFQSKIAYSLRCKADNRLKAALGGITMPEAAANTLVLLTQQKSLPAGLTKELSRLKAVTVSCKEPYAKEAPALIADLAKAEQLHLDQRAVALLARHLGSSPALLAGEIAKLALIFAGDDQGSLSADAIAPHIGAIKEDQAFALEKLLLAGKYADAQVLVSQLLAKGDAPLMVLAILAQFFRKMLSLQLSPAPDRAGALSSLRVPPFAHRDYFSAMPRYPEALCGRALARCQNADLLFKSSKADSAVVLSEVIDGLARL